MKRSVTLTRCKSSLAGTPSWVRQICSLVRPNSKILVQLLPLSTVLFDVLFHRMCCEEVGPALVDSLHGHRIDARHLTAHGIQPSDVVAPLTVIHEDLLQLRLHLFILLRALPEVQKYS